MGDPIAAAADAAASRLPEWVNAEELARAPPEVVLVYQGAQRAGGSDLAVPGVARAVKKATAGGAAGGGSSVTAPHAGLFGTDAATYSPTKMNGDEEVKDQPISARLIAALDDAKKRGGAAKAGGRRFIAGACKPQEQPQNDSFSSSSSPIVWLKEGEELADYMRHRSVAPAPAAAAADVVVICCLLYTSPSPRDATLSRMPSSA